MTGDSGTLVTGVSGAFDARSVGHWVSFGDVGWSLGAWVAGAAGWTARVRACMHACAHLPALVRAHACLAHVECDGRTGCRRAQGHATAAMPRLAPCRTAVPLLKKIAVCMQSPMPKWYLHTTLYPYMHACLYACLHISIHRSLRCSHQQASKNPATCTRTNGRT